jgi:hypothetical protein
MGEMPFWMKEISIRYKLSTVPYFVKRKNCCHCGYKPKFLFTNIPLKGNLSSKEKFLYNIEISNNCWCIDCVKSLFKTSVKI